MCVSGMSGMRVNQITVLIFFPLFPFLPLHPSPPTGVPPPTPRARCHMQNGGCQHLCHQSPGGVTCSCREGSVSHSASQVLVTQFLRQSCSWADSQYNGQFFLIWTTLFGVSSFLGSSGFAGFFVVFFVVPLSCLLCCEKKKSECVL